MKPSQVVHNCLVFLYTCIRGTKEIWFRDHQPWLLSCGYQLRPRFQPDWVPSWVTNPPASIHEMRDREDHASRRIWAVTDALRLRDGKTVVLKRVYSQESEISSELQIGQFVSSPRQMQDPDNHCVPIYEVLKVPDDPDQVIIVMPLLRNFDDPRFDTVGEGLDCIYQLLRGLRYLHRNGIAHRDGNKNNIMMDASELYPDGYHPVKHDWNRDFTGSAVQKYTRTQRPPKYYFIDFGLSLQFDASDAHPLAYPMPGGDKSVPEHEGIDPLNPTANEQQDPFPTDIYYMGNLIRLYFTEGIPNDMYMGRKLGFEFLTPLVQQMTQDDPAKRPTIEQCVIYFENLVRSQSSWSYRAQVWHSTDNAFGFAYRFFPHWFRRAVAIVLQTPAIPSWGE